MGRKYAKLVTLVIGSREKDLISESFTSFIPEMKQFVSVSGAAVIGIPFIPVTCALHFGDHLLLFLT